MHKAVRWSLVGLFLVLIVGLSFSLGFVLRPAIDQSDPAQASAVARDGDPDFYVLSEMYRVLRDNYVDPSKVQAGQLRGGAINGLLEAVGDTHQAYLTKEQLQQSETDLRGQFEGIGASVDRRNGEIVIARPFDESPAKKAGLRAGDVILEVNGESTDGWTTQQAVSKIRGPRGTEVRLKVRRTDGTVETVAVTRDRILLPSVRVETPNDGAGAPATDVAYIRIDQFTQRTGDEMRDALKSLQDGGYRGLILDLRNNPGGLVRTCMDVASQFMKSGTTVFIEQGRSGSEEVFKTRDGGLALDVPLVVLVNKNSASCSEILAGSMRENGRAVVLGEQTLGKGTVNRYFDLKQDGGAVYVSIARWLTPKREQIEGKGISPDAVVKPAEGEDANGYYNTPMYRAVDRLRNGA
jgi:carboxyl-terminal processing protease